VPTVKVCGRASRGKLLGPERWKASAPILSGIDYQGGGVSCPAQSQNIFTAVPSRTILVKKCRTF